MRQRGFSLFEAVITVALFSLALLLLSQLFSSYRGLGARAESEEEPMLEARRALQLILTETQGALEVLSPLAGSSATSLQIKVVDPAGQRFPVGPSWTPAQASVDVTYTVTAQGLVRTQTAQPSASQASKVQGLEVTLSNDHRLDVRLSVNLDGSLRTLKGSSYYWVRAQ